MPHTKKTTPKKPKEEDEVEEITPEKITAKKGFDFESIIDPVVVDKIEEIEPLVETEESEDGAEEGLGLDDEEINPFKDKWEE